jgi:hypothetical protein
MALSKLISNQLEIFNNSISSIDHIFRNFSTEGAVEDTHPSGFSDHLCISIKFPSLFSPPPLPKYEYRRIFSKSNIQNFISEISQEQLHEVYQAHDTNSKHHIFSSIFFLLL